MTDKELTPEQDEAVRRLLGEARHDEPMPDSVANRLDDVLAGLVAERAEPPADAKPRAVVVPIRQRRWPKVLVAAAAVSAFGLGISQLDLGTTAGDDSDAGSAVDRVTSLDGQAEEAPMAPDVTANGDDAKNSANWKRQYYDLTGVDTAQLSELSLELDQLRDGAAVRPIDRQSLRRSLTAFAEEVGPQSTAADSKVMNKFVVAGNRATYDAQIAPQPCGPIYNVVGGKAAYARYGDRLALVVFHPEVHGIQLVELYVCSGKTPRRSVERVTLWDGE